MKCDLNPLKQNRNKTASYQLLTYTLLYQPNFMAFQTGAPRADHLKIYQIAENL